jgi:hypothetical protein
LKPSTPKEVLVIIQGCYMIKLSKEMLIENGRMTEKLKDDFDALGRVYDRTCPSVNFGNVSFVPDPKFMEVVDKHFSINGGKKKRIQFSDFFQK